jgi:hypothetical protein
MGMASADTEELGNYPDTVTPYDEEKDEYTCNAGLSVKDIVGKGTRERGVGIAGEMG